MLFRNNGARSFFFVLIPSLSLLLASNGKVATAESIGMCWGQVAWQVMTPTIAVDLLQRNNITKVKLFNADPEALNAMAGTGIEIMVMVKNQDLQSISSNEDAAQSWVNDNVAAFIPAGIIIKYISVGNEPFLANLHTYDKILFDAVKNIYDSLKVAGLDKEVKVTVSFNSEILANTSPPSSAVINSTWQDQVYNVVSLVHNTSSVFSVNIYPFYNYRGGDIEQDLIFLGGTSHPSQFSDNTTGLVYTNIFDATYDSVLHALEKLNPVFAEVKVIIGEIGWPTDGDTVATLALAESFNGPMIRHMYSGVGTPKLPNKTIEGYLFGFFDEDAKGIQAGPFERKWGLYTSQGNPKYSLDLTGQALTSNVALPSAKGIDLLPAKWCVASPDANSSALAQVFTDICNATTYDFAGFADCTPVTYKTTTPGEQCWSPGTASTNTSFVLNAYFQNQAQNESACLFNGTGVIVTENPSSSSCTFPRGLDLDKMNTFGASSDSFSVYVLGYIVGLIILLANFL